ncbi:putative FCP1 domain, HAD superfamily protein [Helianthus annuus]|nr:putative FCP1 domain, HAD superfamily protein [Helianthus annuus]KAJ0642000.1 putative FCP1 domain, HAD superfamily protein [Helianthus annuus]
MEYAAAAKRRKISHATKEAHFDNRKKLLVLGVDGLLADVLPDPNEAVFKRPFCDDFLKFCFQRFNVGVWTTTTRYIMEHALDCLMRETQHKLLFCWHRAHCTKKGSSLENGYIIFVKDLTKLWEKKYANLPWEVGEYDESNTLLVEIYPHTTLLNPVSAFSL